MGGKERGSSAAEPSQQGASAQVRVRSRVGRGKRCRAPTVNLSAGALTSLSSCRVPLLTAASRGWVTGQRSLRRMLKVQVSVRLRSTAASLSTCVSSRVNGQSSNLEYVHVMHDGIFNYTQAFQVTLTCSLMIFKFPFDTQTCNLSIASFLYPGTAACQVLPQLD